MERTLLKTSIIALVAAPAAMAAASVMGAVNTFGSAPEPSFQPLATRTVRTITIPATERPLHPAPGLRLSRLDADGCGVSARAVRQPDGSLRTVHETFCRH